MFVSFVGLKETLPCQKPLGGIVVCCLVSTNIERHMKQEVESSYGGNRL